MALSEHSRNGFFESHTAECGIDYLAVGSERRQGHAGFSSHSCLQSSIVACEVKVWPTSRQVQPRCVAFCRDQRDLIRADDSHAYARVHRV